MSAAFTADVVMGTCYLTAALCAGWGAYEIVQAAGRYVDRREAAKHAAREQARLDTLAYLIEKSPGWRALNLPPEQAREFAEWEAEIHL